MNKTLEIRHSAQLEIRSKGRRIEGYAALFGVESVPLGDFTEVIERGAFTDTLLRDLANDPALFLWGHDSNQPLASTRPGTLQLNEDSRGLEFHAELPATSWANDAIESVNAGLVGTSFGFRIGRDRWEYKENKNKRFLLQVDLREISLTPMPAYQQTLGEQVVRSKDGRPVDIEHQHLLNRLLYHELRTK
jgi:uncharacterized protein